MVGKFNAILRDTGRGVMEALKGPMNDLIGFLGRIRPTLQAWGAAVGNAISLLVEAFKAGALPALFKDGLLVAAAAMVNSVNRGFQAVIKSLLAALGEIPTFMNAALNVLTDPSFWGGLDRLAAALGSKFRRAFTPMTDDYEAQVIRGEEIMMKQAVKAFGKAFATVGKPVEEAAAKVSAAFSDGMAAEDIWDASGNRERMGETLAGLQAIIDKRKEEKESVKELERAKAGLIQKRIGDEEEEERKDPFGAVAARVKPVVSSLGRIGGAAIRGNRVERMDRERNALLKQIKENTGRGTVAVYS